MRPGSQDRLLLRVFIDERDKWQGQPLAEAIVMLALKRGMAGATCFKGILGYGAGQQLHSKKPLGITDNLAVVVEILDTEERIQEFLPQLEAMVGDGMATIQPVKVLFYRPTKAVDSDESLKVIGS